jgi:hypothetical protein
MKKISLVLFLLIVKASLGQNCGRVEGFNDKKTGKQQFTGLVSSDDHFTMFLTRTNNKMDSTMNSEYSVLLTAAAPRLLPDSVLKTFAKLELSLMSGNRLTIDSVKCSNNPKWMGTSVSFQTPFSEFEMKTLQSDPILKFLVTDILFTTFSGKKLKQQKDIAACLLK